MFIVFVLLLCALPVLLRLLGNWYLSHLKPRTFTFSAGQAVYGLSLREIRVLEFEIFESNTYVKHGITLRDGDCVFDIGANIGLSSIFFAQQRKNVTVHAFEPIPILVEAGALNAASDHLVKANGSRIFLHPFGISTEATPQTFSFNPFMTIITSSLQSQRQLKLVKGLNGDWLSVPIAVVKDLKRFGVRPPFMIDAFLWWLLTPVLNYLISCFLFLPVMLWNHLLFTRRVPCGTRPLSQVITDLKVTCIHLLKVDVEGAEENVLDSIEERHLEIIEQMVIEVHDVDGRLNRLKTKLRDRGFRVVVDMEDLETSRLFKICQLYARKVGCQS